LDVLPGRRRGGTDGSRDDGAAMDASGGAKVRPTSV